MFYILLKFKSFHKNKNTIFRNFKLFEETKKKINEKKKYDKFFHKKKRISVGFLSFKIF